ncbi:hypothetical protein Pyn_03510 [Prunus yedoensis var. nudiflora]|uniref:Uncharacterized protein n=1 Tax=Prunus yedoensis var. nudiflora TaxID=2094558 RepID=A0A314YGA4_PRUYE|nr:hypothetical protein Pyn_03510 [Prunus yedoensis var. nudiflora]
MSLTVKLHVTTSYLNACKNTTKVWGRARGRAIDFFTAGSLLVSNTTLIFVGFLLRESDAVNSNPTAAPMKQPNSDFAANFQAPDHYFLPKDRALVKPAGPNPCIPRVGGKRSWPELVGEIGEAAAAMIERRILMFEQSL